MRYKPPPTRRQETDHGQFLTADEHEALRLTAELGRLLRRIVGDPEMAPDDWEELAGALRVIHRAVASQAAARAYPDLYRPPGA